MEILTHSQTKRRIQASTKKWLKDRGYDKQLSCNCQRGTFIINNCDNYLLTAKLILQQANPEYSFQEITTSTAKLMLNK